MNGIFVFFLSLLIIESHAQGINFQGVARSANGTILASSNISLRLSVLSKSVDATPEYVETKKVVTNAQGIFSIVIGDGVTATVGTFKNVNWAETPKFLKVEMDPSGSTSYINMGITQLQYVPYSFYTLGVAADNITGVLSVAKGGTGVGSLEELKTALKITTVDTTSLSKRIDSKLTKGDTASLSSRIDGKLSKADTASLSNRISFKADYLAPGLNGNFMASNGTNWISTKPTNLNITGKYTSGSITYPNTDGISGQFLTTNGAGVLSWSNPVSSNNLSTSSNGTIIFVKPNNEIWKSNYDGTNQVKINISNLPINYEIVNDQILISPNGLELYFLLYTPTTNQSLYKCNIDGTGLTKIVDNVDELNNISVSISAGVPYTGASQAVDLGAYDLKVNGLTIGIGSGNSSATINTAIGKYVLQVNTTGTQNTAVGYQTLNQNSTGYDNTAIGYMSLNSNSVGNGNTATGNLTLGSNIGGALNSAFGWSSLASNTSGNFNSAFGIRSLNSNTTGSENSSFGSLTLYKNTTGSSNSAFGNNSLNNNTTGIGNTAIGYNALLNNTTGSNTAIGNNSLNGNTTGSSNTGIGESALASNKVNSGNIAIGFEAIRFSNDNTSGGSITLNTGVGFRALTGSNIPSNNTGTNNTALGGQALQNNTSGSANTAIGVQALQNNTTGSSNYALGNSSLYANTSGNFNSSFSGWSLNRNTIGERNSAFGLNNLSYNTTGSFNSSFGMNGMNNNTTGSYNTTLGYQSLQTNTTGSNNTALGYNADVASGNLTNATALGNGAVVSASNTIQLGNTSVTDVKTSGVITTAGIAIGTKSNTAAALEINSTTQGFLPPRMTASQRDAISTIVAGLVVWCSNCGNYGELQVYNGNSWTNMIGGTASSVNSSPPPPSSSEAAIAFSINVDPGTGNILAVTGTSQAIIVTVNSTLPSSGVNVQVTVTKDSDNSTVYTSSISTVNSANNITITGLTSGVLCTATVVVTSRTSSSNTLTKTFKLAAR